jgi:hypothetical protein
MCICRSLALVAALLLVPATLSATHSVSHEEHGFRYYLATERDTYVTYEYVPIEFSVTNISGDKLAFFSPCSDIFMCIMIWDPVGPFHPEPVVIWYDGCGCMDEVTGHTLEPDGSYVREPVWDMHNIYSGDPIWRTGTHTIEAGFSAFDLEWQSIGYTLTLDFEVLPGAASAQEPSETWGTIKRLYR